MSYPTLPFALVSHLAEISPERAKLRTDTRQITLFAHQDKGISSRRYEIDTDDQWAALLEGIVSLYASGTWDTMGVIYSTTGDDPVDIGVIVEHGKPDMVISWTYAPIFDVRLIESGPTYDQVVKGVGLDSIRSLLASAKPTQLKIPAAGSGPSVSPIFAKPN